MVEGCAFDAFPWRFMDNVAVCAFPAIPLWGAAYLLCIVTCTDPIDHHYSHLRRFPLSSRSYNKPLPARRMAFPTHRPSTAPDAIDRKAFPPSVSLVNSHASADVPPDIADSGTTPTGRDQRGTPPLRAYPHLRSSQLKQGPFAWGWIQHDRPVGETSGYRA